MSSDQTSMHLTIHHLNGDNDPVGRTARRAIRAIIDEHGFYPDSGRRWELRAAELSAYEVRHAETYQVAEQLIAADPRAVFECWEGPTDEWLGCHASYAPILGLFTASCDHRGALVVPTASVLHTLAVADNLDHARSMIAERAGVRHSALVNQIKATKAHYRELLGRPRNQGGAT